jgi:hypothetical protein
MALPRLVLCFVSTCNQRFFDDHIQTAVSQDG